MLNYNKRKPKQQKTKTKKPVREIGRPHILAAELYGKALALFEFMCRLVHYNLPETQDDECYDLGQLTDFDTSDFRYHQTAALLTSKCSLLMLDLHKETCLGKSLSVSVLEALTERYDALKKDVDKFNDSTDDDEDYDPFAGTP